jgi:REP element-mobilizing transposase RayT
MMIARFFIGKERNFTGENFWARGYFVFTVGLDETTVIEYIRNQEAEEGTPRTIEAAYAALSGPRSLKPL